MRWYVHIPMTDLAGHVEVILRIVKVSKLLKHTYVLTLLRVKIN